MKTGARPPEVVDFERRFSKNLAFFRVERRMTRKTLAAETGIPDHMIEKIEDLTRNRPASIGEAIVLAQALGVQPGEMLK